MQLVVRRVAFTALVPPRHANDPTPHHAISRGPTLNDAGDDPVVVKRLAGLVGLNPDKILSGTEIAALSDEALAVQVRTVDAFGRLAPDQKSRIVKALQ